MENIVRKGEIACNKQFLLFSRCFLPYMTLIFHFNSTSKCGLQFVDWNLDQSKMLLSGYGLNSPTHQPTCLPSLVLSIMSQ